MLFADKINGALLMSHSEEDQNVSADSVGANAADDARIRPTAWGGDLSRRRLPLTFIIRNIRNM